MKQLNLFLQFWFVFFIILVSANERSLASPSSQVILLANDASSDCRRPMAAGFSTPHNVFFSWSGPNMRPQVAQCDQTTLSCKIVDLGPIQQHDGYYDLHDYTQLIRAADGHLLIFYTTHNHRLWQLRSPHADSIEGQWTKTEILNSQKQSLPASYPMPVVSRSGMIYLFYRHTTDVQDYRPEVYVKSSDHGNSWSEPQPAIDFLNKRTDHLNEIYVGRIVPDTNQDRFLISWSIAGGGPKTHAHDVYQKNVYFSYFDPTSESFFSVSGQNLGKFIEIDEAERFCLVYDSGPLEQKVKLQVNYELLVQQDPHSKTPVIAFQDKARDQSILAHWAQGQWLFTNLAFLPKDLVTLQQNVLRAIVPTKQSVSIYDSKDAGASWQLIQDVPMPHRIHRIVAAQGNSSLLMGQPTTKMNDDSSAAEGHAPVYLIKLTD